MYHTWILWVLYSTFLIIVSFFEAEHSFTQILRTNMNLVSRLVPFLLGGMCGELAGLAFSTFIKRKDDIDLCFCCGTS